MSCIQGSCIGYINSITLICVYLLPMLKQTSNKIFSVNVLLWMHGAHPIGKSWLPRRYTRSN